MNEDDLKKIIEETVNTTVLKMKMAGLMRNNRKTAYQKTEELLYNYTTFKNSDQPYARKISVKIEEALKDIEDDHYYEIIPMTYFDRETREAIAIEFNTSERTISRNKGRLINIIKVKLFSDDVIFELFL